jgi:hypothetical protein
VAARIFPNEFWGTSFFSSSGTVTFMPFMVQGEL